MTTLTSFQERHLKQFTIVDSNLEKPWGGYFCIDPKQVRAFIAQFFGEIADEFPEEHFALLSPKLLVVLPEKRLSWQYHFRRAEFWKILEGPVNVPLSETDEEPTSSEPIAAGTLLRIPQGFRHRLIGLEPIGVVAEIWQHTQPLHLSDEQDIVRVQDDFNRK